MRDNRDNRDNFSKLFSPEALYSWISTIKMAGYKAQGGDIEYRPSARKWYKTNQRVGGDRQFTYGHLSTQYQVTH